MAPSSVGVGVVNTQKKKPTNLDEILIEILNYPE